MTHFLPPVLKLAERLQLDIEVAVSKFPRSHRYATGLRLRDQVFELTCAAHWAWRHRDSQPELIGELSRMVDQLKITLQLGSRLRAFSSFGQFEALARMASDLGRQVGGWSKHRNGQNAHGCATVREQRAKTLSTGGALAGAKS